MKLLTDIPTTDTYHANVMVKSSNGDPIDDAQFTGVATKFSRIDKGKYEFSFSEYGVVEVVAPGYDKNSFRIEPFKQEYPDVILNRSSSGSIPKTHPNE